MKNLIWGLVLAIGFLCQTVTHAQTVSLGKPATLRAKSSSAQSYEWTFPGGIVINGEVVQFTFTEAGPQEVKLKVTDLEGNTNEITKRILVANDGRPTAVIETLVNGKRVSGNTIEATLKDVISFKSESFALEKTAQDFSELWTVNGRNYSADSLPSVFDKIGTYSVRLTVQDPLSSRQQDQTSVQVKINNLPPVIQAIEIEPLGNSLEQFRVGVRAEDPDGSLTTYKFEALKAGQTMMTQVTESNTTVFDLSRFPGTHTYNFRVTVSDDRFLSTTYTDNRMITVDPLNTNTPPEVTLQVLPGNQGYVGEAFDFKAAATDADNDALKYEWIVSDGRRSSTSAFRLIFNKAGKYTITLNVNDGLATATEKLDLTVLEPETLVVENTAPEVEIYGILPGNSAPMNSMFRFYLKATDADGDRLTYEWDFGNGSKSFTQNAAILYNLPGEYTVKVKVSDGIETVTDEVKVTVELGPREIYYESVDDRLVDLQSERQRILDAIAANGGEITPAQRAQLQSLNNDLSDLIGEARKAGDFAVITKLEQISQSLDAAVGNIEAAVYDGMTLTQLGESLKEEQAQTIENLVNEAKILAETDANLKAEAAAQQQAFIEAAKTQNVVLKTKISDSRSDLKKQKTDLELELKAARQEGKTQNATLLENQLNTVNSSIESAAEKNHVLQENILAQQGQLRANKERLLGELATTRTAGDANNLQVLQARLNTVNAEISQAQVQNVQLQADILDGRESLDKEKVDLLAAINLARKNNNQDNLIKAQARLESVNSEISAATEATLAVQANVLAVRESLQIEKTTLLNELSQARATQDALNVERISARLQIVNEQIETATADTIAVNKSLSSSRELLESEKSDLLVEVKAARAAGDAVNLEKFNARLSTVNSEISAATEATLAVQASLLASQTDLEAEKARLFITLNEATRTGDTENQARAAARLEVVNREIFAATEQTLVIQDSLRESRVLLTEEKASLNADIKGAQQAGKTENQAAAMARLEVVNDQIANANAATLKMQESLEQSRMTLQSEKVELQNSLEQSKAEGNRTNQARLEARVAVVDASLVEANKATLDLQTEIETLRAALEGEKTEQMQALAEAKAQGNTVNAARAQDRLNEVNAQLSDAKTVQDETQSNIESERLMLEQSKEDLYQQYAVAKEVGDDAALARVQEQIIATEKLLASLSSKSSAEYYAEQRARYEARKTSIQLVISELEKAKKSGKSIEEFTAALKTQANTANPNSEEFKSAAAALEQQELIKRADFIEQQIQTLDALSVNPTSLPPLGVHRKSNETLPERLDRIANQAGRAAIEAEQRQNAAAQIASAKQAELIEQRLRLQQDLQSEGDESRQAVIAARIAVIEKEIAHLEPLKNPGEILSSADIAQRMVELTAATQQANQTVITEQQAFMATRLAELQLEIDLAADPRVKADLEGQKKRLEVNLNQRGILTDYQAQLQASQKALNERLATNLNSTAQLLVQTQLNSVETKLDNIEKLKASQANLKTLESTGTKNPEAEAAEFLKTEKTNLERELSEVKVQTARTSDAVERKALEQRATEIQKRLEDFPNTNVELASLDSLKVVRAVDYLVHYRSVEAQALSLGLEDEKPAQLSLIDTQIKTLNRLNNFGYTPQTSLSTLLTDLDRREGELLVLYRDADGAKAEDLKQRLVVLSGAVEQISGLEKYQIQKSDSVYRATEKLKVALSITSEAYLNAVTESDRVVALQKLNEMRVSERWLNRFYNAEKRDLTLGELEISLRESVKDKDEAQTVEDLVALQSIKANLDLAITARLETDFENFKLNLQKQAAQVSDPNEKAAIEARIKSLVSTDLVSNVTLAKANMFEELLADLTIKVDTNLFLYADIPLTQHDQALLFEWDLGDGEKRFGQNISHEYYEAGFYRVVLTMTDGVTSQQDLFTIKVTE